MVFSICTEDIATLDSILDPLDVEIVCAPAPALAARLVRTRRFVLALLDLDCDPHWKQSLQALRDLAPKLLVVACSRLADEHLWIDALEAGAHDFVSKPFSPLELSAVWKSALHQSTPLTGAS
jgi:DNA-binding response OmpR family regulator